MVSLVEVAVRRRAEIRQLADTFYSVFIERAGVEAAKAIRRQPPPAAAGRGVPHLVEDGGSAIEVLEAYAVYAVRAWAAVYDAAADGSYPEASSASDAAVGLVIPYTAHERRVRVYREIVEAYAALNALRRASGVRGGVILWDGSLSTIIASDRPGASELPLQKAEEKLKDALGYERTRELWDALEKPVLHRASNPGGPLAYEEITGRIAAERGLTADDWPLVAFVEWHEKALAYKMLLEEAWSRGFLPVFIAKTSTSKMLFKAPLPDIYYLRREEPVDPFTTTVRVYRGFRELKLGLEEVGRRGGPFFLPNLQDFYDSLIVYAFYARLSRGGPILKVEVAVPPGGPGPEEAAERAYRALASLPLKGGYPYPLVAAHSRARVTREDMDRVLHALGLYLERRGRHMLP